LGLSRATESKEVTGDWPKLNGVSNTEEKMKTIYRLVNLIDQLRIETVTKAIARLFLKCRPEEPSSFRSWSNRPLLRFAPILLCPLISCAVVRQEFSRPGVERIRRVQPTVAKILLETEDPGKIMIAHGSACAETDDPGEEEIIELAGTFTLPFYANAATVFLNGWRLRYLGGDEHFKSVSAAITDIEVILSTLSWVAQGHLRDDDFQDGYEFCYNYTLLAWNRDLVDLFADHSDDHVNGRDSSSQDTTALSALSSYIQNGDFAGKKTVAIIPQGFWLGWGEDRHLLQLAYNLDHAEAFVRAGDSYDFLLPPAGSADASRVDQTIRRWESYSILKENDLRHYYSFWEHFSALAGNDLTVIEPPFTILPKEDIGLGEGCLGGPEVGLHSQDVEVRNLRFDYVVPVLSGWDLRYACDDEHVKEIGIWLENITYEKEPGSPTGTLRYTVVSVLRDDDDWPGHYSRHKVTILGLNGREPADLVPYESAPSFCKKDADGRLLVTVSNSGKGDAPASTTEVRFNTLGRIKLIDPPITLIATPPIPRGFIATLEPVDLPPLCANGCSITITADFHSDVMEIDESNNVAEGSCIVLSDS
jgi:CARDB